MYSHHESTKTYGLEDDQDIRQRVRFTHLPGLTRASTLASDARAGLLGGDKRLPPKYFYDARGSELFEKICTTSEYYPTRIESRLLALHVMDILDELRPGTLVEIGSGSSEKTVHFFNASERLGLPIQYQPLDVCLEALEVASIKLSARFPWLEIDALVGDYATDIARLPEAQGPRLFLFLGGTIGNLTHTEALAFLRTLHASMRPEDSFLLGFDRVKDPAILNAAYNDRAGYTAEFNLNLLNVLNDKLDSHFACADFVHRARFDEEKHQIEMYLVATRAHDVAIPRIGTSAHFAQGESILTEISRKFTPEGMQELLQAAGFLWKRHITPKNQYFSLAIVQRQ